MDTQMQPYDENITMCIIEEKLETWKVYVTW